MISFRSSVRPIVRPAVLSSVLQFECKFLSLMHVCLSVIFLISFMLFNELYRFLSEIETDNLTVSNSEIITLDFTV